MPAGVTVSRSAVRQPHCSEHGAVQARCSIRARSRIGVRLDTHARLEKTDRSVHASSDFHHNAAPFKGSHAVGLDGDTLRTALYHYLQCRQAVA